MKISSERKKNAIVFKRKVDDTQAKNYTQVKIIKQFELFY